MLFYWAPAHQREEAEGVFELDSACKTILETFIHIYYLCDIVCYFSNPKYTCFCYFSNPKRACFCNFSNQSSNFTQKAECKW